MLFLAISWLGNVGLCAVLQVAEVSSGCLRFGQPAEIDSVRAVLAEAQVPFLLTPVRTAIRERPHAEDQWEPVARVLAAFEATDLGRRALAQVDGGKADAVAMFGLEAAETVDTQEAGRFGFLYHVLGAGVAFRWYSQGELSAPYCAAYFAIRHTTAACPSYGLAATDLGTTELVLHTLQDVAVHSADVRSMAQVLRVMNAHTLSPPVLSQLKADRREVPKELRNREWFQELPEERQVELYLQDLEQVLDVPARHRWEAIELAERHLDPEY